jgi:LysM repeat protein
MLGLFLLVVGDTAPAATAAPVRAQLTIEASTGSPTSVLVPSQATLRCDGDATATGFLENVAAAACKIVRRGAVVRVAAAYRTPRLCGVVYGGPQHARITGTIAGRRINLSLDRNDGCGIADWNRLEGLLGDPRRRGRIPRRTRSTTTTTAPPVTYQVRRGDSLTRIAQQFHTSVPAIVALNRIIDPDALTEGQQLTMPPPSAVRIKTRLVDGSATAGVELALIGAQPSELVTFQIVLPDGSTNTGAPHSASSEGVVTATYSAEIAPGTYRIVATGTAGTTAEKTFHLHPADG